MSTIRRTYHIINSDDEYSQGEEEYLSEYKEVIGIWTERSYIGDTLHGVSKVYYDDGIIEEEENYVESFDDARELYDV